MLRNLILSLITLSFATAALPPQASAQTETVTYNLEGVMFGFTGYEMTGSFDWTYQVGDFENGVGNFTSINIPWYGSDLNGLTWTVELDQIELTLSQSWHSQGVDVMLRLSSDLSLTQPAMVNTATSTYDVVPGGAGTISAGAVVPEPGLGMSLSGACPSLTFDITYATPSGSVALLYANGTGSFVVPNGMACAGTVLGLNNTVALASMLQADANGNVTLSANVPAGACGAFYVQALDMTSCETSTVLLLP